METVDEAELHNLIEKHYVELAPRVLNYAKKVFSMYSRGTHEFDGHDAESIMSEAFEKVASGRYRTKLSAGLTKNQLLKCLFDAVWGMCGNLPRLKEAEAPF